MFRVEEISIRTPPHDVQPIASCRVCWERRHAQIFYPKYNILYRQRSVFTESYDAPRNHGKGIGFVTNVSGPSSPPISVHYVR